MINTLHKPVMLAAVVLTALAFSPGSANAQQTENVAATVEVLNALTITEVDPLHFGTVAAISDGTGIATLTIDAATGALATSTTAAPAVFAVIDSATATRAQITVEDGAVGAVLNFEIDNVVDPLFGGNSFTLDGWETSWNGSAVLPRTAAAPFQYTFVTGVNTLNIGAAISTKTAVATYTDGIYAGSFDVVVSY